MVKTGVHNIPTNLGVHLKNSRCQKGNIKQFSHWGPTDIRHLVTMQFKFWFVDHASLYNLVNKANLVHNLFLVYLSISTCFRWLCAHHQAKQLSGMQGGIPPCIPDSHPHRITSTKCCINRVVSPVGFIYKIMQSLIPVAVWCLGFSALGIMFLWQLSWWRRDNDLFVEGWESGNSYTSHTCGLISCHKMLTEWIVHKAKLSYKFLECFLLLCLWSKNGCWNEGS
jgi:hypothetical protein